MKALNENITKFVDEQSSPTSVETSTVTPSTLVTPVTSTILTTPTSATIPTTPKTPPSPTTPKTPPSPTSPKTPPSTTAPPTPMTVVNCSFIKPSLSMTSLPPPNGQNDGSGLIKAKLRVERPYNSLKKKRNVESDTWRHSWGSGNSSCSLHGSGFCSGKDDFWAALQSNYNYIMDTNLLDACKEARFEIESAVDVKATSSDCCLKMLGSNRSERSAEDPRELKKWLKDMEQKLSNSPTLSEATQMSVVELQKRLADHSVLYCEIVSHARVVGACIRASEKENEQQQNSLSSEEKVSLSSPNGKRYDGNLKGLERRYHLLYLKAIEVQCLFEGLLGKKNSSSVLSKASSTETDDEPVAKLAKLSNSESQAYTSCCLQSLDHTGTASDENKSESDLDDIENDNYWLDEEEDFLHNGKQNIERNFAYSTSSLSRFSRGNNNQRQFLEQLNADFDADSEGSDGEIVIIRKDNISRYYYSLGSRKKGNTIEYNRKEDFQTFSTEDNQLQEQKYQESKLILSHKTHKHESVLSEINMESDSYCNAVLNNKEVVTENGNSGSIDTALSVQLKTDKKIEILENKIHELIPGKDITCSELEKSPNSKNNIIGKKRFRSIDNSKFNRSNRKSKNCAIFYFKHLDTDNENFGGISSQGSDVLKSGEEQSSEEDPWVYSSDCVDGGGVDMLDEDSDKENKKMDNVSDELDTTLNESITTDELNDTLTEKPKKNNDHTTADATTQKELNNFENVPKGSHIRTLFNDFNNVAENILKRNVNIQESHSIAAEITLGKDCSHESIRKLVHDAEMLVREEALRTPKKRHSSKAANSGKNKDSSGQNIQRIQEWLERQTIVQKEQNSSPFRQTTDCEASGEYTESDTGARESDTSEGLTDSVATCMQVNGGGSTSQCTSTEKIGSSVDHIVSIPSNPSLNYGSSTNGNGYGNSTGSVNSGNKVVRRGTSRRNAGRPWSVSSLSQLTEGADTIINSNKSNNNKGLASHSISESAIHILSSPGQRKSTLSQQNQVSIKNSDSKNSLKRRKIRRRKTAHPKRVDSGSDGIYPKINQSLIKNEATVGTIKIIEDLKEALSIASQSKTTSSITTVVDSKQEEKSATTQPESEEETNLMKPNFKLGSYISAYMTNESKLGSLAALANYMNEDRTVAEYNTGTEDHSSFSEQAWDNYQEKYNSENYSEGLDTDAARRLLEFGDDYRNFLDSQSDACSSLSAANNIDSLSPPRMDSLKQNEHHKLPKQSGSTVDHTRRRHVLELEYERRRRSCEVKKKSSQESLRSPTISCSSTLNSSILKVNEELLQQNDGFYNKRFDTSANTHYNGRKKSESDNSLRRRKSEDVLNSRRRSSRTLDKSFKAIPPTSSSSCDDSDDEKEIKNLLTQSKNRLENTNALKIRSHLLRSEDYIEITETCRSNIRCLESVLRSSAVVLSMIKANETRDLLSSWESLLKWSENGGAARKMQEEMIHLKNSINRLGKQNCDFDSETSIRVIIEELMREKAQLQSHRSNMLRLNAQVHSWLTRQELKLKNELEAINNDAENDNGNQEKGSQINSIVLSENEFHKQLKDEVSDMYEAWDDAEKRINNMLESLNASVIALNQFECGLNEFHQVLGKDRGTLRGLEGALTQGQTTSAELAQNVKLVAKLLSEKMNNQQKNATAEELTSSGRLVFPIAQFTSSNGSLSDSGISDGGATSDGGLSEREQRLSNLRRIVKQLENILAPGSEKLKSITARMEAAEAELKTLQNTCRDLIVRTAASQNEKSQGVITFNIQAPSQRMKKSPQSKRRNKRKSINNVLTQNGNGCLATNSKTYQKSSSSVTRNNNTLQGRNCQTNSGDPDDDDPKDDTLDIIANNEKGRSGWVWRIAKFASPIQLTFLTIIWATILLQPHCCDSLNNFANSLTPQFRYIRGPPPI